MDIKNVTQSDHKQLASIASKLDEFYSRLPATKGCMENINKEGGCGAWCCETITPHVLSCEFKNTWKYVSDNWTKKQIVELIAEAVRSYLSLGFHKGCIFWEKTTKLCKQHSTRPYNCRAYGIMPEEEWKPRYERLKIINDSVRPQCDLVSTEDDKPVTKGMIDSWWKMLVRIEASTGVAHARINDRVGGTYKTYYDHILQALYSPQILAQLTKLRMHGSEDAKEKFVQTLIKAYETSGQTKDGGKNGKANTEEQKTGDTTTGTSQETNQSQDNQSQL